VDEVFMPSANVYEPLDSISPSSKRNWSEAIQIAVLSAIILVFLAIAAGSLVSLAVSAMHH
jgi:hypothetical protein